LSVGSRYAPVPVNWVPNRLVSSSPVRTGTGAYLVGSIIRRIKIIVIFKKTKENRENQ
jgi:hypothetical protein